MQEECGGWLGKSGAAAAAGSLCSISRAPTSCQIFFPLPCYNDSVGWLRWLSLGSFGLGGWFLATLMY